MNRARTYPTPRQCDCSTTNGDQCRRPASMVAYTLPRPTYSGRTLPARVYGYCAYHGDVILLRPIALPDGIVGIVTIRSRKCLRDGHNFDPRNPGYCWECGYPETDPEGVAL